MTNEPKINDKWLKLSCFLTRRVDLSHDEFDRYRTKVQTPILAKPIPDAPMVHRYVQLHTITEDVPALQTAPDDGVAEIWFDNLADAAAMFTSDHYNNIVATDEKNFLDRPKTAFLYSYEKAMKNQSFNTLTD